MTTAPEPAVPTGEAGRPAPAPRDSGTPAAGPVVLKKRADFLAAARGRRWAAPGLVLQGRPRGDGEGAPGLIRVGYTCSKKVGGAVVRNRAKRRLRAVAAEVLPAEGRPGWDYVLIGRSGATVARPFAALLDDLREALRRVHAAGAAGNNAGKRAG